MNWSLLCPTASESPASQCQIEGSTQSEFSYRWWLASPGRDESLRSLVERADRLYGVTREQTYVWQDQTSTAANLDAPSSLELLRLARMLGVPARELARHRLRDHPSLLNPSQRRAYCPQCIYEDCQEGRPRVFRRACSYFNAPCTISRCSGLNRGWRLSGTRLPVVLGIQRVPIRSKFCSSLPRFRKPWRRACGWTRPGPLLGVAVLTRHALY